MSDKRQPRWRPILVDPIAHLRNDPEWQRQQAELEAQRDDAAAERWRKFAEEAGVELVEGPEL